MTLKFPFTDSQKQAVTSRNSMVVTACPGSGKTTVIVEKIRRDLEVLEDFQGVIGISFTIKASKELANKCRANGANVRSSFFGTIDNFCLSEIIFPFISKIYGRLKLPLECIQFSELGSSYKEKLPNLSASGVVIQTNDYRALEVEFRKHYAAGFILLEALTVIAYHVVENSQACQRYLQARFNSIYVDEYQDTSEPQHRLFCKIHELGLTAVAVGDMQQSIYAFRGSDSNHLRSLIADDKNFEHHVIEKNHRCHPSIVNYANRLFSPTCELQPVAQNEISVFRREFEGNQENVAIQLNEWIPKAAGIRKISNLSNVAILTRGNGSIDLLQQHLNIPARFYRDDALSTIPSPLARLFTTLLQFYFDDGRLVGQILMDFPPHKLKSNQVKMLRRSITALRSEDIGGLADAICVIARNLTGVAEFPREIIALKSVIASKEAMKQYEKISEAEVQVMTLHKSKGLEFDMVVHLDLYDWVFPYREYTGSFDDFSYPNWDQDLNLHYVGITRARNCCVLVTSKKRTNSQGQVKNGTPSPFFNLKGLEGLFR